MASYIKGKTQPSPHCLSDIQILIIWKPTYSTRSTFIEVDKIKICLTGPISIPDLDYTVSKFLSKLGTCMAGICCWMCTVASRGWNGKPSTG